MRNDSFDFKTTRINSGIVLIVPDLIIFKNIDGNRIDRRSYIRIKVFYLYSNIFNGDFPKIKFIRRHGGFVFAWKQLKFVYGFVDWIYYIIRRSNNDSLMKVPKLSVIFAKMVVKHLCYFRVFAYHFSILMQRDG